MMSSDALITMARVTVEALFNGLWLAAIPGAMWRLATRKGPVGYDKMAHGTAPPAEPIRPGTTGG